MSKKLLTKTIFIERSNKIHMNRYDYSLVNYVHSKTNVIIICKVHGEFKQSPSKHMLGQGCKYCNGGFKKTNDEFIIDAKKVHGDKYDYSIVKYTNNKTKVDIICPIHGGFKQRPGD